MTNTQNITLPTNVKSTDCTYPKWSKTNRVVDSFELWYTERFGWVIPTLTISKAKFGTARRTYAIAIKDGQICTVGNGPHVLAQTTVYVTPKRQKALQSFLDIRTKGQGNAGMIRDRISTRRANTSLRRAQFGW